MRMCCWILFEFSWSLISTYVQKEIRKCRSSECHHRAKYANSCSAEVVSELSVVMEELRFLSWLVSKTWWHYLESKYIQPVACCIKLLSCGVLQPTIYQSNVVQQIGYLAGNTETLLCVYSISGELHDVRYLPVSVWWANLAWLLEGHPAALSLPFLSRTRVGKEREMFMCQDKDRAKQTWLGEDVFIFWSILSQRCAASFAGGLSCALQLVHHRAACSWLRPAWGSRRPLLTAVTQQLLCCQHPAVGTRWGLEAGWWGAKREFSIWLPQRKWA